MCLKTENRDKLQASFFGSTRKKHLTAAFYMSHKIKQLIANYWNKLKQIKIDTNGNLATLILKKDV